MLLAPPSFLLRAALSEAATSPPATWALPALASCPHSSCKFSYASCWQAGWGLLLWSLTRVWCKEETHKLKNCQTKNRQHFQPAHTRNLLIAAARFVSRKRLSPPCRWGTWLNADGRVDSPSYRAAFQRQQSAPGYLLQGLLGLPRKRSPPQAKVGDSALSSPLGAYSTAPTP